MTWNAIVHAIRVFGLIFLSASVGAVTRLYISSRREEPSMALYPYIAFICYTIAAGGELLHNISEQGHFKWWLSPFVLFGSSAILIGIIPHLKWRRGRWGSAVHTGGRMVLTMVIDEEPALTKVWSVVIYHPAEEHRHKKRWSLSLYIAVVVTVILGLMIWQYANYGHL